MTVHSLKLLKGLFLAYVLRERSSFFCLAYPQSPPSPSHGRNETTMPPTEVLELEGALLMPFPQDFLKNKDLLLMSCRVLFQKLILQ